jgi:hypothetical protein
LAQYFKLTLLAVGDIDNLTLLVGRLIDIKVLYFQPLLLEWLVLRLLVVGNSSMQWRAKGDLAISVSFGNRGA